MRADLARKAAALDEAEKRLFVYGDHKPSCIKRKWSSSNLHDPDYVDCDCGWSDILKPIVDAGVAAYRAAALEQGHE